MENIVKYYSELEEMGKQKTKSYQLMQDKGSHGRKACPIGRFIEQNIIGTGENRYFPHNQSRVCHLKLIFLLPTLLLLKINLPLFPFFFTIKTQNVPISFSYYNIQYYIRFMKHQTSSTLLLFILFALIFHQSASRSLQATSARTSSVTNNCASFSSRYKLISNQSITEAQTNKQAFGLSFTTSGNDLISGILKDFSSISAQIPTLATPLGIYIGPFALGFIIILLIWPFLCCCCCCPSCCPSKCCQKDQSEPYTKCEMYWPAIVLILALLLAISASTFGMTKSSDIQTAVKTLSCSISIAFDDILNGNTSTTGKFFLGLNNALTAIGQLKANLDPVKAEAQKLDYMNVTGVIRPLTDQGESLLTQVTKIPTNTANGTMASFSYNHFDGTTGPVSSTFPVILGNADPTAGTGSVNTAYQSLLTVNNDFKKIGTDCTSFINDFNTVNSSIDDYTTKFFDLNKLISDLDTTINGQGVSGATSYINLGFTAFFAAIVGLSSLGLIGALMSIFGKKQSCRYLIYITCIVLFILGLIGFLLAVIISLFSPVLYFACDFLDVTLSSQVNLTANIGTLIDVQYQNYLGVCLPGSSGDFLTTVLGQTTVNKIMKSINTISFYDDAVIQAQVSTGFNSLETVINQYYYSDLYDFSSDTDLALLTRVSVPSNYPLCTVNSFQTDKWVPSTRQSIISCSGTSPSASSAQCPTSVQIQGGRASSSCFGCIDSVKVLINSGSAQSADLGARYNNANCNTWKTEMMNIWNNYYSVKKTQMDPVRNRFINAHNKYNMATYGYKDKISEVAPKFQQISNNLATAVPMIFNKQYGAIVGLNCLILGEDLNLIVDSICKPLLNSFVALRLPLGISAFAILFIMCCSTCSGVRAYKDAARRGYINPNTKGEGDKSINHFKS